MNLNNKNYSNRESEPNPTLNSDCSVLNSLFSLLQVGIQNTFLRFLRVHLFVVSTLVNYDSNSISAATLKWSDATRPHPDSPWWGGGGRKWLSPPPPAAARPFVEGLLLWSPVLCYHFIWHVTVLPTNLTMISNFPEPLFCPPHFHPTPTPRRRVSGSRPDFAIPSVWLGLILTHVIRKLWLFSLIGKTLPPSFKSCMNIRFCVGKATSSENMDFLHAFKWMEPKALNLKVSFPTAQLCRIQGERSMNFRALPTFLRWNKHFQGNFLSISLQIFCF